MLHYMPDIAFAGVFGHIEKVVVRARPEQVVFVAVYVYILFQSARIHFHIAIIQRICKSHQMDQVHVFESDGGFLLKFAVGGGKSVLAEFYLSAPTVDKPLVRVFSARSHNLALGLCIDHRH